MRQSAGSFPRATRGTVNPSPVAVLWFGFARLVSCFVLALVLSLFVAPGAAQAHGLHGSVKVTVPTAALDGSTKADAAGGSEMSESNCLTCCASSSCVAVFIPETFDLSDAEEAKSGFQTASTVAVYQMAQHGLRRPPRENA